MNTVQSKAVLQNKHRAFMGLTLNFIDYLTYILAYKHTIIIYGLTYQKYEETALKIKCCVKRIFNIEI